MEIFKLIGSVMVDTADAKKSIQKTSDEAEGFGNKLSSGIKTAGKWAAGVAAGAAAVGAAMIKASKDTAAQMDEIDKGSQRMKITAQSYQELAHAASLSGVEMSTLERAAKKLEGTDMNLDDALEQIYSLGTAEERAAKASELFGDTVAYQMTPMLNASAEDMAAMKQEAHDLGLVMSEDAVKSGAEMGDMFSKVEQSLSTLKNQLMAEMMPYVMEILQWVIENIPMIRETVKSVMDAILPIVKPILNMVMQLLPPLLNAIKRLLDWIMPYLKPIISAISSLVQGFTKLMQGDVEGFVNGIISFLQGIVSTFLNIGQAIFGALWDGLVSVWNSIASWIVDKVNWLADKLAFWRRGNSEMAGESHAGGLPYVPYDNYPAILHRGESVMTAADSQGLLSDVRKIAESGGSNSQPITIVVQSVLDGRVIGETVTKYQKQKARAFG